jgi:hypothetical protein
MKTKFKSSILVAAVAIISLTIASCEKSPSDNLRFGSILDVDAESISAVNLRNLQDILPDTILLDPEETDVLKSLMEEEKLARDVYTALYAKWGSLIFSKISVSEDTHMNAVISLLKASGSADTVPSVAGVFVNPVYQQLYSDLVTAGSVSVEEAYKTGALIEEMDITDIRNVEASVTDECIIMVFENLMKGSRNHLRAFSKQLSLLGITYTPVYLTADEYTKIITTASETGRQYMMKGRGHHGSDSCRY